MKKFKKQVMLLIIFLIFEVIYNTLDMNNGVSAYSFGGYGNLDIYGSDNIWCEGWEEMTENGNGWGPYWSGAKASTYFWRGYCNNQLYFGYNLDTIKAHKNVYCAQKNKLIECPVLWTTISWSVDIIGNTANFYYHDALGGRESTPFKTVNNEMNNKIAYVTSQIEPDRGAQMNGATSSFASGSQHEFWAQWNSWLSACGIWGYTTDSSSSSSDRMANYKSGTTYKVRLYYFDVQFGEENNSILRTGFGAQGTTWADGQNIVVADTWSPLEDPRINIPVKKVWNDDGGYGNRPNSVNLTLLLNDEVAGYLNLTKDGGWKGKFENLKDTTTYTVKEDDVSKAYDTRVTGNQNDGFIVTNTLKTTSVKVTKIWDDDNNRDGKRANATVTLYETIDGKKTESKDANGKIRTATLGKGTNNKATATFKNLPQYRNGKQITYSVEETKCPTGYTKSKVTKIPNKTNEFEITNSHTPERIPEIKVTKVWDDVSNKEKTRPEKITIVLKNGSTIVDKRELMGKSNKWTATFENHYKYEKGKEIDYKVEEIGVPESTDECAVTVSVEGSIKDGFTITNKFVPKTEYRVHKKWDDDDNRDGLRPGNIKITLYADGKKVQTDGDGNSMINPQTIKPNSNGDWIYYFTNLLKYNSKEEIIKYTVKEEVVPNRYEVDIKSY